MTKQEFLGGLRAALAGRIEASLISENIYYYEDYINTQVRMGRAEAEVVRGLGDPRLIAKSIVEANKHAGTDNNDGSEYQNANEGYAGKGYYGGSYAENAGYANQNGYRRKLIKMPGWLMAIIVGVVFFLIMLLMFSVFSFIMPLILPLLLVGMIVKFFRNT